MSLVLRDQLPPSTTQYHSTMAVCHRPSRADGTWLIPSQGRTASSELPVGQHIIWLRPLSITVLLSTSLVWLVLTSALLHNTSSTQVSLQAVTQPPAF